MTLQITLLALLIIALHIKAGWTWERYFRQEKARQKQNEEKQNS